MTHREPLPVVNGGGRRVRLLGGIVLASALVLAACSSGTAGSSASSVATSAPTAAGGSASSSASSAASTVSANTASRDQLVAALTAAGVPNPDRWATEIMEYRPYDASDPTLQHLQDQLAKYNPDPATLRGILSVLTP